MRLGLSEEDLAALLGRFNQSPNIGVVDLGRLLAAAKREAASRRFDQVTCADIMTRNLITARPDTPVVDAAGRCTGLIVQTDVIEALLPPRRVFGGGKAGHPVASELMQAPIRAVPHDLPEGHLLNRLAAQRAETIPVVREGTLVGIITRLDIIGLLIRGSEHRTAA